VTEEQIGYAVIGAALKVHSTVGPGLLESAYEACLLYELGKSDLPVRRQVLIPVRYENLTIDNGYRIDLLPVDARQVEIGRLRTHFQDRRNILRRDHCIVLRPSDRR